MLKQFSSNTRKLNRVISKINLNNLNDSLYITASLLNVQVPASNSFQSNVRKNPYPTKVVNTIGLNDNSYTTLITFYKILESNIISCIPIF